MYARSFILVAGLTLAPLLSAVERNEFIISLSPDLESRIIQENRFDVEEAAFFAKRYRIVRLNTDLLFEDTSEIAISPFPDVTIRLRKQSFNRRNNDLGFTWTGRYTDTPLSRQEFIAQQGPSDASAERTAGRIYDKIFSVRITGSKYTFDQKTGKTKSLSGMRYDPVQRRHVTEHEKFLADSRPDLAVFYEVLFNLHPPAIDSESNFPYSAAYLLRSLPGDRRYHVIYELDESKTVPTRLENAKPTAEQAERLRRYNDDLARRNRERSASENSGDAK